jgi:hypothetical protein
LLAAAALTGCASHIQTLQTPNHASSPTDDKPISDALASGKVVGKRQLGIDIDWYNYAGFNIGAAAATDVAYLKRLHANAMSVSFPFFITGPDAKSVFAASATTPTPGQLAIVARAAKRAALYFSIRPLLDEGTLQKAHYSRTGWTPPDLGAWFASYERFLKPYAKMAQRNEIPEFFIGVEFDQFTGSPYWAKLAAYLRRYYHGTLAYSNNWSAPIANRINASGVVQMADAYPVMHVPDSASIASLTANWDAYLRMKPRGIVLSEVGIAAQSEAYHRPYNAIWNGKPLKPAIQANWFTAVCNAVAQENAAGVYFWPVNFGQPLNVPPNTSYPSGFVAGRGARSIAACFKRLG